MRALKRLKEQLKHWREACGCGFDPSLLSDVARQVICYCFLFLLLIFCCSCRCRFSSRSSSKHCRTTSSIFDVVTPPCALL